MEQSTQKISKLKENLEVSWTGTAPSPLAYVAAIQSQYEQSPRYKYSDPAVVLMSKVYQTTDSIHVETATLPGNSSTNRDWAGVCLSLSEYHYGMSGERARKSERGCLSLLIMQHHSLCIDPAGWSCLHIVRIKIIFSLKKKKRKERKNRKISLWFIQLCNKQTTMKWFVVGWILSGIFPLVFTQYAPIM